MALGSTRSGAGGTTVTTTTQTVHHPAPAKKPGLMSRLRGNKRTHQANTTGTRRARRTHGTHGATVTPRRKTSIGDKVSGAMMKLRGSLERKPGLKAAGTRRMHGTDGKGARRVY